MFTVEGRNRRPKLMSVVVAAAFVGLFTSVLTPMQAQAADKPAVFQDKPVPGHHAGRLHAYATGTSSKSAQPTESPLPEAGTFSVALAAGAASSVSTFTGGRKKSARVAGAWRHLGESGLEVAPAVSADGSAGAIGTVKAMVLSRQQSASYGVSGLAVQLSRAASGAATPLAVRVPDSLLAGQYGADYASRLRWVQLPADAAGGAGEARGEESGVFASPAAAVNAQPVAQGVDAASKSVVLSPVVGARPVVLAAVAGPVSSTGTGSFAATPLNAASAWDVSAQTGDFSWQYPMRTPPAAAGPSPSLSLDYDSQSIDGETGSTNNQPSAIGEGWSLGASGFIERTYVSCSLDDGASGAVTSSGDLCWKTDNATISLAGHSGQLVKASDGTWHLQSDDGSRIQHLVGTAAGCAANGTYDTDCWLLTTTDGTKYYFGLNELPGWATGKATTNSAWTVPVFGNDTGEPCHASTFAASSCVQGWRWNLDYVVDVHGNAEALYYNAETNKYARDGASTVSYTRGGQLNHIDYGFVDGQAYAVNAASDRVLFGYDVYGRCSDTTHKSCTSEAITSAATAPAHPTSYPDVPFDQYCTAASCTGKVSPVFFTDGMLDTVTTQVLSGSSYANVDVWALGHSFPSPGDGTNAALWLTQVAHTGYSGSTSLSEPVTGFQGQTLQNRVWVVDGLAPLDKYRVTTISTSLGATISVGYSAQQCTPAGAAAIEAAPQSNTNRCFPQWWVPQVTPPQAAQEDLFHKYVVTSVIADPVTGGGYDRPQETDYVYTGTPAWRYDTSPFTPTKQRTWDVFAGYSSVEVRVGDHNTPAGQQATDYSFFQGMDGDRASTSGGSKSVYVTGSTSVRDSRWLAGQVRDTTVLGGVGGAVVSEAVSTPWASAVTADDGSNTARYTGDGTSAVTEPVSTGGNRTTTTTTGYNSENLPVTVQTTHSDTGTSTCTSTTYAPKNTTAWLVGLPEEVATLATTCGDTGQAVYPRDAISDTRTSYDGAGWGATPSKGDVTATQVVDSYTGSTAGTAHWVTSTTSAYDAMGRVTSATDVLGHTTTTAYTPAASSTGARPATSVTTTNTLGWTTTTGYNPARGAETSATDQNGKVTTAAYDALGRRVGVWLPGRPQGSYGSSPSMAYAYTLSKTTPNAIVTTTIGPSAMKTDDTLFDGLGRQVQTQTAASGGGTVVADTAYDVAGRVSMTDGPYWTASVNPSTALFVPTSLQQVTPVNYTSYDGAGRPVKIELDSLGAERSETDTTYLGADRTDVTPPAGGTPSSSFSNSLGQQTKLTQYLNATPSGTAQSTTYTYDAQGHMASMMDPAGNTWSWGFDVLGHQITATDPDTGTTTSTCDDAGEVLTTTDARGITLAYSYDALGRKTAQYQGSAGSNGSELASWTYDTLAKGQLTSSASYTGSTPGNPGLAYTTTVTGYDDGYRSTGETVSIPTGAPAFGGTSYVTKRYYNPDGSPSSTWLPAAGGLPVEKLRFTYDGFARPSAMSGDATYALASYSAVGRLTQLQRPGTTLTAYSEYGYDAATGLVSEIGESTVTGTTYASVADRQYTRDDAGNITSAKTTSDTTVTDTQCYTYDHLSELTAAWTPSSGDCTEAPQASTLGGAAPYLQQYTYDTTTGNRLSATVVNGTSSTQQVYAYPAAGSAHPHAVQSVTSTGDTNQTDTYGYDQDGDTTSRPGQSLTYDPTGKLASITSGASTQSDVYDASGTLLLRTDSTGSTLLLGETELHQAAGSTEVSAVRTYTLAGKTIAERSTQPGVSGNGTLQWLGTDVDGTADVEVDATTGAVTRRYSDPFGNARGSIPAWSSDHGFLNKTEDTFTGLTQLGARVYDATLGRFLSVDPVLAPQNPVQDNGYDYSANNPITNADPSGACYQTNMDALNFHTNCVGSVGRNNGNGADYVASVGGKPSAAGNSSSDYALYKAVQLSHATAESPVNKTSPWQLGAQWLTGVGPRHQDFHDNDPFTRLLEQHENIRDDVVKAGNALAQGGYHYGEVLNGDYDYSLGGWDGVAKYAGDYFTLVDGGKTGNLAVTFLGSYNVQVIPLAPRGRHGATVLFKVTNSSTLASATHLPLYGVIPGYEHVEDFENSLVPTGPLSKTTQTISWTQDISWK